MASDRISKYTQYHYLHRHYLPQDYWNQKLAREWDATHFPDSPWKASILQRINIIISFMTPLPLTQEERNKNLIRSYIEEIFSKHNLSSIERYFLVLLS